MSSKLYVPYYSAGLWHIDEVDCCSNEKQPAPTKRLMTSPVHFACLGPGESISYHEQTVTNNSDRSVSVYRMNNHIYIEPAVKLLRGQW